MSEELFRFVVMRSPEIPEPDEFIEVGSVGAGNRPDADFYASELKSIKAVRDSIEQYAQDVDTDQPELGDATDAVEHRPGRPTDENFVDELLQAQELPSLDDAEEWQRIEGTIAKGLETVEDPENLALLASSAQTVAAIRSLSNDADLAIRRLNQPVQVPDRPYTPGDRDASVDSALALASQRRRHLVRDVNNQLTQLTTLGKAHKSVEKALRANATTLRAELDTEESQDDASSFDGVIQRAGRWLGLLSHTESAGGPQTLGGTFSLSRADLDDDTLAVLGNLELDPDTDHADQIIAEVASSVRASSRKLETLMSDTSAGATRDLRSQTRLAMRAGDEAIEFADMVEYQSDKAEYLELPTPRISPSGLGQLLVVRQTLKAYFPNEVAHIENALAGESRSREHRRRQFTEELFSTEREREYEEETNLASAERFEMSTESKSVVDKKLDADARLEVTGSWGPTVDFSASGGVAVSSSKSEATSSATKFSREVSEEASVRIAERVREKRQRRTIEEIEEINKHEIDNSAGNNNRSGVYQWVDKVYEAQVYDYGLRTLYDVMVPQPAAYAVAMSSPNSGQTGSMPKAPDPFEIEPQDLQWHNYDTYVARFGATDVDAPPDNVIRVTAAFGGTKHKDWKKRSTTSVESLTIPEGYQSTSVEMSSSVSGKKGSTIEAHIGAVELIEIHSAGSLTSAQLPELTGEVRIATRAWHAASWAMSIAVIANITQHTYEQWQLDTHTKIRTAYEARLSEYRQAMDEALAALQQQEIRDGVKIEGSNPNWNRKLIAGELKRAALAIVTGSHTGADSPMTIDLFGTPLFSVPNSIDQGKRVRFFEQAFEWDKLNYVLYSYAWGHRPNHWDQAVLHEDPDPLFAEFVRAGSARVQLAVRRGFEEAVDWYMRTGQVWEGGEVPSIGDEMYVPYAVEHSEQLGRPGDEELVGDPWDVRLPTTLVKLRQDDKLPTWTEDATTGEWVPGPDVAP